MDWEMDFLRFISENFHNEFADAFMLAVTSLGNYGFIWILLCCVLIMFSKTRKTGICMAVSLIIVFVSVNVVFKPLFDRARPFEISPEIAKSIIIALPQDGSFPSGHTAAAFAAGRAAFTSGKKAGAVVMLCAFVMGISRLYFAVHFPTDVVGGALWGMCCGAFGCFLGAYFKK